jgi:hypothetical protein
VKKAAVAASAIRELAGAQPDPVALASGLRSEHADAVILRGSPLTGAPPPGREAESRSS